MVLVANAYLQVPPSRFIQSVVVAQGFDVADNYIVKRVLKRDLVVTGDIPLAAELVESAASVITPRGEKLNPENIRQRLQMRNIREELRTSGLHTSGPAPLDSRDKQRFANGLDQWLAANSQA